MYKPWCGRCVGWSSVQIEEGISFLRTRKYEHNYLLILQPPYPVPLWKKFQIYINSSCRFYPLCNYVFTTQKLCKFFSLWKKYGEPLTARFEDAKIEEFSGEIETAGLGNFDLHGQNDGGRVPEIGLDTNEGGVVDGFSSEEVCPGNGLRFVRSNLLHTHTPYRSYFFLLHSQ